MPPGGLVRPERLPAPTATRGATAGDDGRKAAYAQHLTADQSRGTPAICRELGDMPASTLYHYLHADGSLKAPGRKLLGTQTRTDGGDPKGPRGDEAVIDRPGARTVA